MIDKQILSLKPFLSDIRYPEGLPVSKHIDQIADMLQQYQVIIVSGETGSGKTTQLPKICLALGRGQKGWIGHTQPRRLAATSTARRIAQELDTRLGEVVGYKVRFADTLEPGVSIKLMTDGILLAETQSDPLLQQYDTLIIDEAHERSLNIDFILGYLKQILPQRPDLKIIITSATIDADRFAQHFASHIHPAPVLNVSGRLYPVEIRYRPLSQELLLSVKGRDSTKEKNQPEYDLYMGIIDAIAELNRLGTGDILVFLPGEREIREAAEALRKHHPAHTEILPLFARLSVQEQERIFYPGNAGRIILATNVAETSLTVPGIHYVVDSGLARIKRYSYRNKVEQLQIEPIAQAAASQRAGRCGRVTAGVCIRLYEEQTFLLRPKFTDPEIQRSSLAAVILRMKSLNLPAVEAFPFIDPPSGRAIADGYQLLQELSALNEQNHLTAIGRHLAKLPIDPRIARMIIAAQEQHCLAEILIIASALEIQDPRERPEETQETADQMHKKFIDERSDFLSYLKLWNWFTEVLNQKKSNRQLALLCRENFVSQSRFREWRDIHDQLQTLVAEQGWRLNKQPATYEQIHTALLAGLLGNVACKIEGEPYYLGARGIRILLWPGSVLSKRTNQSTPANKNKWIMAAELIETSRLFARCVARIEPSWIERIAPHVLKKSYSDPHWEKKPAQVIAYERATLYGLPIYTQRRIHYGRINPQEAHTLFIREALVQQQFETQAEFFQHNQKLITEIKQLEYKARRPDVLADETLIIAFYTQRIPEYIHDGRSFETWRKQAEMTQPTLLFLSREELMRHEAAGITTDFFPKIFNHRGLEFILSYHFEPGVPRDGVTLTIPLSFLNQIDPIPCEWLVPGMLKEKVQLLLKSLPQKLRRACVPLPNYAVAFCERYAEASVRQQPLLDALIKDIRECTGNIVKQSDFKWETLPPHVYMNFKIIDEQSRQLAMGRNLSVLRAELGEPARQAFQAAAQDALQKKQKTKSKIDSKEEETQQPSPTSFKLKTQLTDWDFGALPEIAEIEKEGQHWIGYPALVDYQTYCAIEIFDDPIQARQVHYLGLRCLFSLQLKEQLKFLGKNFPEFQTMGMLYIALGSVEELRQQLLEVTVARVCLVDPLPIDSASFKNRLAQAKTRLNLLGQELARQTLLILQEYAQLQKKMLQLKTFPEARNDMVQQLQQLLPKRFILSTPVNQYNHLPRYLKAVSLRIDKLKTEPKRDGLKMAEFQPLLQKYQRVLGQRKGQMDIRLQEFRWLLEELRVSLFAQELRTPMPVSVKRLQKIWAQLQT